jgi:hypothetical protein
MRMQIFPETDKMRMRLLMGRKATYSRENAHEHILNTEKMRTRITPNGYGSLF